MSAKSFLKNLAAAPGSLHLEKHYKSLIGAFGGADPFTLNEQGSLPGLLGSAALTQCLDSLAYIMARAPDGERQATWRLARALCSVLIDRKQSVGATLRLAAADHDFANFANEADSARDRKEWGHAEYLYYSALKLYPFHSGYRVQYGHCIKEQGKWAEAEVQYRNALAFGVVTDDTIEHLTSVAAISDRNLNPEILNFATEYWRDDTPSSHPLSSPTSEPDIRAICQLFLENTQWSVAKLCEILNRHPRTIDVIGHVVEMPEFARSNKELLAYLIETEALRA